MIEPNTTPANPPPVEGSERPLQGMAIDLAQFLQTELGKMETRLTEQVRAALQANAQTVKRMEQLEGSVKQLTTDLDVRARERADKDFEEAKTRYELAQRQRDRLSTQEKIEVGQLLEDRDAAAKKARADRWRAHVEKILPNITTAMILSVLVPVWLAIVIAIMGFILRALGISVPLPAP